MTTEEVNKRYEEAAQHTGEKTTVVMVGLMANLEYEMAMWDAQGHQNTEDVSEAIGQCYAGLRILEKYIHADRRDVVAGMRKVLNY